MPPAVAAALARGLTEYGLVAGRWFDEARPTGIYQFVRAPVTNPLRRAWSRLTKEWPAHIVLTTDPAVVVQLFEQGWWMQYQALLVLDPSSEAGRDAALVTLSTRRDWVDFTFQPPIRALLTPGVDGDFALLCAQSSSELSRMTGLISLAFLKDGVILPNVPPEVRS